MKNHKKVPLQLSKFLSCPCCEILNDLQNYIIIETFIFFLPDLCFEHESFQTTVQNRYFVNQTEFKNFTNKMITISKYIDTLFPGPKPTYYYKADSEFLSKCFSINFEFTFFASFSLKGFSLLTLLWNMRFMFLFL